MFSRVCPLERHQSSLSLLDFLCLRVFLPVITPCHLPGDSSETLGGRAPLGFMEYLPRRSITVHSNTARRGMRKGWKIDYYALVKDSLDRNEMTEAYDTAGGRCCGRGGHLTPYRSSGTSQLLRVVNRNEKALHLNTSRLLCSRVDFLSPSVALSSLPSPLRPRRSSQSSLWC